MTIKVKTLVFVNFYEDGEVYVMGTTLDEQLTFEPQI